MKSIKTYLLLFALASLFVPNNIRAQEIFVEANIDNSNIKIGEQTMLKLSLSYTASSGKQIQIIWPEINDTLSSKIDVLGIEKTDTAVTDSLNLFHIKYEKKITITSFDSGAWVIPPFKFLLSGDSQAFYTEPLRLHVNTIAVDTTMAIKDIKPIMDIEYSIIDWIKDNILIVSLALLIIVVIAIAIYYIRKKLNNKEPEIIVEAPKLPPHVVALEKLNKLQEEKLWQQDKTKQYYIELTDIIREYIENRFKIQALEQTSDEILLSFRNTAIDSESLQQLKQILHLSDLVKFAKERPLPHENELSLNNAFSFIKGTLREEEKQP